MLGLFEVLGFEPSASQGNTVLESRFRNWNRPEVPATKRDKTPIEKIDALDLSMVKMKLCLAVEQEGKGWTMEEADIVEVHYKRFLKLHILQPETVVPTKPIDEMWHGHILDLRKYEQDCKDVFGKMLYHYPYFGMRGDADVQNAEKAFEKTKDMFIHHFGEPMYPLGGKWGKCYAGKCTKCGGMN